MNFLIKIFFVIILIFPISNSFGAMVTFVQNSEVKSESVVPGGVHFNPDGTKMFVVSQSKDGDFSKVYEYNLSKPFDISSKSYAGDSETCNLDNSDGGDSFGPNMNTTFGLEFSNDGMKLFVGTGGIANDEERDRVFRFDLTSPYDVSTCSFANQTPGLDTDALQDGSNAGDRERDEEGELYALRRYRLQGVEISNDGKKLFIIMHGHNTEGPVVRNTRLLEYSLTTAFDLSSLSLISNAGIELEDEVMNPKDIRFSPDGKRIWAVDHQNSQVNITQISLDVAFSTSSFTIDGSFSLAQDQPAGIAFSTNGLKMYIGRDVDEQVIEEYDLVCPFNLFAGKCNALTEGDRTGMADAQMELARRTIDHSTNSALNRLKWIRRNKDKQDLTNLQIDINFSNQMLASLTEAVKTSAIKKNKPFKDKNVFYWSEGSISVGKMGDTNVSTSKEINANSLTLGADKFTDNNGIIGWALRYGNDHTKVGYAGSNLNADTFNLTLYNTRPSSVDNKYIDTIFGIGKLNLDILNLLDGESLIARRSGTQMYGTVKLKDEIIKNNLTIIPSAQIDFGHTIFDSYKETGTSAMSFKKQHVKSRNLRAAIAAVDKVENEKYSIKRHGKLEYQANLKRSSNIKYTYVDEPSNAFNTKLQSGSLHNINGEVGIDIIFPENYSLFIIYERKQAISQGNFNKGHSTGYTDNFYIALGYLPGKNTEYAFKLNGSENLMSKLEIKKDIKGFDLIFNLNDDLTNLGDAREAYIELNKVF